MIRRVKSQNGFTLIELILALAFVSFILIFAVTAVIQVMGTYNKGLAVKDINQAGRAALEDMARMARVADPTAINTGQLSRGRVCFGAVSYVWNTTNTDLNQYSDNNEPVLLARVKDAGGALCGSSLPDVERENATELLATRAWVQNVDIAVAGELVTLSLQLTVADNPSDPVLQGGTCTGASAGQFCATAVFETTVTTRGG